jgi:hypothetical protein
MRALEALEKNREKLLALPGVVGVGLGRDDGEIIELLVEERSWEYPDEIDGVPVRVRMVGKLKAEDEGSG